MTPGRWHYAAGALGSLALLGAGYYLQYVEGQEPCPLCLVQRGFYLLLGLVYAAAALHRPARAGALAYGAGAALLAAGGAAVAARQVWLQHLPPEEVPPCGPDLYYMLGHLPLGRVLEKLFAGSGQCAEVNWTLLGLSIAEWSLVCFAALAAYGLWLAAKAR
jgi:disulfide bond formation protein DsbB